MSEKRNVRLEMAPGIYDKLTELFNGVELVSDEDIVEELGIGPSHFYLKVLRELGYVAIDLDCRYRKIKDFPERGIDLTYEYKGLNGPKPTKLRAFRHPEEFKSTSVQVGGSHYKKYKCQPITLSIATRMSGTQLLVLKYIMRYQDKNGLEDLKKAKHLCDMCIELKDFSPVVKRKLYLVSEFIQVNNLTGIIARLTEGIAVCNWESVLNDIQTLINEYEAK